MRYTLTLFYVALLKKHWSSKFFKATEGISYISIVAVPPPPPKKEPESLSSSAYDDFESTKNFTDPGVAVLIYMYNLTLCIWGFDVFWYKIGLAPSAVTFEYYIRNKARNVSKNWTEMEPNNFSKNGILTNPRPNHDLKPVICLFSKPETVFFVSVHLPR